METNDTTNYLGAVERALNGLEKLRKVRNKYRRQKQAAGWRQT